MSKVHFFAVNGQNIFQFNGLPTHSHCCTNKIVPMVALASHKSGPYT